MIHKSTLIILLWFFSIFSIIAEEVNITKPVGEWVYLNGVQRGIIPMTLSLKKGDWLSFPDFSCDYYYEQGKNFEFQFDKGLFRVNGKIFGIDMYSADPQQWQKAKDLQFIALQDGISIETLKKFTSPSVRTIRMYRVNHEYLAYLPKFSGLKGLMLWCRDLQDSDVQKYVKPLKGLSLLDFSHSKITDQGIIGLAKQEQLKILVLGMTNVDCSALRKTENFPQLMTLFLVKTKTNDQTVDYISKLPNLNSVCLDATPITDEALKPLSRCLNIRHLCIRGTKIGDKGFSYLSSPFVSLNLENTLITEQSLKHIAQMPSLQFLFLGNLLDAPGIAQLKNLKLLEVLSLDRLENGDQVMSHLKHFPKLSVLYVRNSEITDKGIQEIAKLRELKCLSLASCAVGNKELTRLENCSSLVYLDLSSTKVDKSCAIPLKKLTNLTSLHLWNTAITQEQAKEMEKSLAVSIQGQFPQSLPNVPLNSKEYDKLMFAAGEYQKQRIYQKALVYYQKAAEITKTADVFARIADVYKFLGKWQQAEKTLKYAIEQNPQDINLLCGLAEIKNFHNDFAAIRQIHKKIIKLQPDQAFFLAKNYRDYFAKAGNMKEAEYYLAQSLKMKPNDFVLLREASQFYESTKNWQMALHYYQKFFDKIPQNHREKYVEKKKELENKIKEK